LSKPIKPKKRTTIYADPNIHELFAKLCRQENKSVSEKTETFWGRYVAVHMPGNPQLPLESFINKPEKTCYKCEGHFPKLTPVEFISGLHALVCDGCKKDYEDRRLIRKVLRKG